MSLWDVTFFVDLDSERNQRRLKQMIDEQYRIAYISQGSVSYHDVGTLTTEERQMVIETIKQIKEEEKQAAERATGKKSSQQYSDPSYSSKSYSSKSAMNSSRK